MESSFVPPNSIEVDSKKISGAAAALGRSFAFWHASILISTDVQLLNRVLLPGKMADKTKFIRSRWRPVTTLEQTLGKHVELKDVEHQLLSLCERAYGVGPVIGELSMNEKQMMESLCVNKYRTIRMEHPWFLWLIERNVEELTLRPLCEFSQHL